ncbi:hypothetical protein [Janthinobacterium psychrotolerans]|uniref:Uncharacterized protein n=1 Tax=Janthinobacterium psychrotolerans TaxID=1747903 RepID=A0A1A7C0T1_9BURK|nr:hypothetical protein [Janthinobacterium psychrotolerans]OBV38614.1 hypothetical protein ASR47_1006214 [Janthinobacterium psychrotolerans]
MPCLSVELDGAPVTTINLAGMVVVDVSVHGALDRNPKAALDAGGGSDAQGGRGYLIWVTELPIQAGAVLKVVFHEACENPDEGKTIEQLFPDEEPCTQTDFTINDEMAAEIRARPQLHQAFSVQVATSQGQQAMAVSDVRNTDFTFRVLWDHTRPHQARAHLSTHCLDDVLARRAGPSHLKAMLDLGDSVSFMLTA